MAEEMPATVELRLGLEFPLLAAAYHRWKEDGLFPQVFHRCPDMSLFDFLDWCYLPTVEPVGCIVGDVLAGIGWIVQAHQIDGQVVAEVGAAFFKGTPLTVWSQSLNLLLEHAFVARKFDSIYGLCGIENRAAGIITRRCGMKQVERLPWPEVVAADSVVCQLDQESWKGTHG